MKPIKIELVDKGIANRFSYPDYELIEINKRLKKHPKLYDAILKHEMEHKEEGYKLDDFKHDMLSKTPGIWKFMLLNPSTWRQLLPFYYDSKRKTWVYDWSAIVMWWILLGVAYTTYYFLRLLL